VSSKAAADCEELCRWKRLFKAGQLLQIDLMFLRKALPSKSMVTIPRLTAVRGAKGG